MVQLDADDYSTPAETHSRSSNVPKRQGTVRVRNAPSVAGELARISRLVPTFSLARRQFHARKEGTQRYFSWARKRRWHSITEPRSGSDRVGADPFKSTKLILSLV